MGKCLQIATTFRTLKARHIKEDQRKGHLPKGQTASKVTIPNIPPEINDEKESIALTFDLGSWLANSKVLSPVLELCKIPSQKEKLLKMLEPQTDDVPLPTSKIVAPEIPAIPKKVTFANTVEQPSPSQENVYEDPPVILHTRDPRKENHPPFYISLMMGDLLLHNCMLDSRSGSNLMTKKIMQQLVLRTTCPYQNVCAHGF